jgi:pyrroline-5-carboxylate reductase
MRGDNSSREGAAMAKNHDQMGFIGAGQMARALAVGMVRGNLVTPRQIVACDPVDAAWEQFVDAVPGAQRAASNTAVVQQASTVFLAIKPQSLAAAAQEMRTALTPETLVVSILAGASLATLSTALGSQRIARVMPNTPCLIGKGASGYACASGCTTADVTRVGELLGAVGIAFPLAEPLLDAVTGLSGSGPAYVFLMIEALSDGGVRAGLPRNIALALASQTVLGAAAMVASTGEHPGVLKDRVASPGGTTIAGLHVLEQQGVRGALISAVEAATRRSQELGNG